MVDTIEMILTFVRWFFAHLIDFAAVTGFASWMLWVLDKLFEAAAVRWPNSKFLKRLDRAFDVGNGITGFILKALDRAAMTHNRKLGEEPKEPS